MLEYVKPTSHLTPVPPTYSKAFSTPANAYDGNSGTSATSDIDSSAMRFILTPPNTAQTVCVAVRIDFQTDNTGAPGDWSWMVENTSEVLLSGNGARARATVWLPLTKHVAAGGSTVNLLAAIPHSGNKTTMTVYEVDFVLVTRGEVSVVST